MKREGLAPIGFGLLVGVIGGVVYGWLVQPVRFTETSPLALRADFQEDYLALIAAAFAATGDLPRAQARLALLPGAGDSTRLTDLARSRLEQGKPDAEVQAIAALAAALSGGVATSAPAPTPIPSSAPTLAATPPPVTALPRPTVLPTFTPGAPFRAGEKTVVCDDPSPIQRLQVVVLELVGGGRSQRAGAGVVGFRPGPVLHRAQTRTGCRLRGLRRGAGGRVHGAARGVGRCRPWHYRRNLHRPLGADPARVGAIDVRAAASPVDRTAVRRLPG